MKKRREKFIAIGLAALGYGAFFGTAVWRFFQRGPDRQPIPNEAPTTAAGLEPVAKKVPANESPAPDEGKSDALESLSLKTPGDAPLDRVARDAAVDEKNATSSEAGLQPSNSPPPTGPPRPWTHDSEIVTDVLRRQSLENERLAGWSKPAPDRLPVPTFAPAVMACGIVIFAMGLATVWYVCVAGSIVFAVAAWRWTGELQGE